MSSMGLSETDCIRTSNEHLDVESPNNRNTSHNFDEMAIRNNYKKTAK